ncbi:MAG: hypothetical protein QXN16_01860, partial [Candidatus Micrarchaeaceae archaeon]
MEKLSKIHIALSIYGRQKKVEENDAFYELSKQGAIINGTLEIKCTDKQISSLLRRFDGTEYNQKTATLTMLPKEAKEKLL